MIVKGPAISDPSSGVCIASCYYCKYVVLFDPKISYVSFHRWALEHRFCSDCLHKDTIWLPIHNPIPVRKVVFRWREEHYRHG
jgi:hypothetical protein